MGRRRAGRRGASRGDAARRHPRVRVGAERTRRGGADRRRRPREFPGGAIAYASTV